MRASVAPHLLRYLVYIGKCKVKDNFFLEEEYVNMSQ